jgi:Tol biopolymer transport system component
MRTQVYTPCNIRQRKKGALSRDLMHTRLFTSLTRFGLPLLVLIALAAGARAQDALNLPAELYILLNNGVVQRYGLGSSGVTQVTPAEDFAVDFGVSPDGTQIAYRTENSINIITIVGPPSERIIERQADVPPYRGLGDTIAWSPDSAAIAYTTTYGARVFFNLGDVAAYADVREGLFVDLRWSPDSRFLAAQTDAGVWWIYRRDATTLSLTSVIPASNGIAWVTGNQIIFPPPEGGLNLMDLDLANAQSVILDASWEYALPTLNAEDELLFFARDQADEATPDGYGRLQSIARGASDVLPRSDTPVLTTGLRWAPGGALLTAFDGGAIALFDPVSGQGFTLPVRDAVAYSWGRFDATRFFATQPAPLVSTVLTPTPELVAVPNSITAVTGVVLPDDAFFLAFGEFNVAQVWRLPASGAPAAPITTAQGGISEYAIAPDLSAIAYVSERQLWLYSLTNGRVTPLVELEAFGIVSPTFSPDAQQIAYTDGGIRAVDIAGGEPRNILLDTPEAEQPSFFGEPQYSPDGTQLLVSELLTGTNGVHGVVNLTDSSYTRLQTDFGVRAFWLSDGSIISFGVTALAGDATEQSIVRFAPDDLTTAEVIYTLASSARIDTIAESVRGEIRLIARLGADSTPSMIDVAFANGDQAEITTLPTILAPRLSFDGGFVGGYLTQNDVEGIVQGPLTIYNANNGEQALLGSPTSVWNFQWAR